MIEINSKHSIDKKKTEEKESLDLQKWNLTEQQEEILEYLSNFLESGYSLQEGLEKSAEILDLDIEKMMYEIEIIKEKIQLNKKERTY